jgi:hypothetical protein
MASSGDNSNLSDATNFVAQIVHHPHAVADLLRSDVPELYANVQGVVADTAKVTGTQPKDSVTVPLQLSGDGMSTVFNNAMSNDVIKTDAVTPAVMTPAAVTQNDAQPGPFQHGSPVISGMSDTLTDAAAFQEHPSFGGAWNVARNAAYSAAIAPRETAIRIAESSVSAVVDNLKKINPF